MGHLASLPAITGMVTIQPAGANEVVEAWKVFMQLRHELAAVILTRQALPTVDRAKYTPARRLAKERTCSPIPKKANRR